jgi:hypothetical protein
MLVRKNVKDIMLSIAKSVQSSVSNVQKSVEECRAAADRFTEFAAFVH